MDFLFIECGQIFIVKRDDDMETKRKERINQRKLWLEALSKEIYTAIDVTLISKDNLYGNGEERITQQTKPLWTKSP